MKIISKKISFLQILLFAFLFFALSFFQRSLGMYNKALKQNIFLQKKLKNQDVNINQEELNKALSFTYQQSNNLKITFLILSFLESVSKKNTPEAINPTDLLLSSFSVNEQSTATYPELKKLIILREFFVHLLKSNQNRLINQLKTDGCECTKEYLQKIENLTDTIKKTPIKLHLIKTFNNSPDYRDPQSFIYPDTDKLNNWASEKQNLSNPHAYFQRICSVQVLLSPFSWLPNLASDIDQYKESITNNNVYYFKKIFEKKYNINNDYQYFKIQIGDPFRSDCNLENILFYFFSKNPDLCREIYEIYNHEVYHFYKTKCDKIKEIKIMNNPSEFSYILLNLLKYGRFEKNTCILMTHTYSLKKSNIDIINFFLKMITIAIKNDISNLTKNHLYIDCSLEKNYEMKNHEITPFPFKDLGIPGIGEENFYYHGYFTDIMRNQKPFDEGNIDLFFKFEDLLKTIEFFTRGKIIYCNSNKLTIQTNGPRSTNKINNFSKKFNTCCKSKNNDEGSPLIITVNNAALDDGIKFSGASSISYIGTPYNNSLTLLKNSIDFFKKPQEFNDIDLSLLLFFQIFFHNKNSDNNFSFFEIPGIIPHDDQCHNKYHTAIQSLQTIIQFTESSPIAKLSSIPGMNAYLIVLYYVLQKKMRLMKNGKNQKIIRLSFKNFPRIVNNYFYFSEHRFAVLDKLIKLKNFINYAMPNDTMSIEIFVQKINKNNLPLSEDFIKSFQFALSLIDSLLLTKGCIEFATELCKNPALNLHKKDMDYLMTKKICPRSDSKNESVLTFFSWYSSNVFYEILKKDQSSDNKYNNAFVAFKRFIILQTHQNIIEQNTIPHIDDLNQFLPILYKIVEDQGLIKKKKIKKSYLLFNITAGINKLAYQIYDTGSKKILAELYQLKQFFSDRDFLEKLPYPKNFLKDLNRAFLLICKYCLNEKFIYSSKELIEMINSNKKISLNLIDEKSCKNISFHLINKIPYGILIEYEGQKITKQIPLTNKNKEAILELFLQNKK